MNENKRLFFKGVILVEAFIEMIYKKFREECFDIMLSEIDLILLIGLYKTDRAVIERSRFMDKYKLIERDLGKGEEEEIEFASIQKFNEHFSNLTVENKLNSIASFRKKFRTIPIYNEYQARSLMALKLGEPDLCFTYRTIEEIIDLNRIQKLLTYKLNKLNPLDDQSKIKTTLEVKKPNISYEDSYKIYKYYIDELESYPDFIIRIESLLQLENDNGFLLYTEICKFIRCIKNYNSKIPVKMRMEKSKLLEFFENIKTNITNIDLPATKISIIRLFQESVNGFDNNVSMESLTTAFLQSLKQLNHRINDFIEEEIKVFPMEIKEDVSRVYNHQNYVINLSEAFFIADAVRVIKSKNTKRKILENYMRDLIKDNKNKVQEVLQQNSFYNHDFKNVDIASFNRINKKTTVTVKKLQ